MTPALELSGVVKDFKGLRPLRIDGLSVEPGEQIAILGVDQPSAEILVNLITGTTLPDRGEVRVFGRLTSAIRDSDDWMVFVDRIGIVSERAVLLDAFSVLQNLAIPFSLDVDPLPGELRRRAEALAEEVGLAEADWPRRAGDLDPAARVRIRLGRAVALAPSLVLVEHPTAGVARGLMASLSRDLRTVLARRGAVGLVLTADKELAAAGFDRALTLDPSTGRLVPPRTGWLGRLRNV